MRKIVLIIISALIALSFAACGNSSKEAENVAEPSAENTAVDTPIAEPPAEAGTEHASESSSQSSAEESEAETSPESIKTAASKTPEPSETHIADGSEQKKTESGTSNNTPGSSVLVAYFSVTGTTKGVAEKIAKAENADLYEIIPAEPYTDEDLNYNSDSSRTTNEQNDENSRPEISGEVPNWDGYKIVYLGYPIWWGEAPRIMDTFIESYNFDGKTIIPFCTSGSSGVGSSAKNLEALANGGAWEEGARFSGSVSESEIADWVEEAVPLN